MTIYSTLPSLMIFPGPMLVIFYVAGNRHSLHFSCTPSLPDKLCDTVGDQPEPNFLA
jgi:hypothetical protein